MSTLNLHRLFNPKTVAVIGASGKRRSIGFSIMKNLLKNRFKGEIFPVNRKYKDVFGLPCYSKIEDVKSIVDLAVIAVPIRSIPKIVDSCGKTGVAGIVIISSNRSGVKENEEAVEAKIIEKVNTYKLHLVGPNCLGIINTSKALNASITHLSPLPGEIAFISQSAAVCTSVLGLADREKIGFSHFISVDSMIDIDIADMIDYLGSLNSVKSIAMYIEDIPNIRNFMSAARSVSRIKPIIALKSGISKTGALIDEDDFYDAAFRRAGILRVNEFEELLDCSKLLTKTSPSSGSRITIITNAGGPGVMATNSLLSNGIEPAELSTETIKKLGKILPANWNQKNPIEILGDIKPEIYTETAKICANTDETDALLLIFSTTADIDKLNTVKPLTESLKVLPCPIFSVWIGGDNVTKARKAFNKAGITTYGSTERAIRAFKNLYQYGCNIEALLEIPVRTDKKLIIDRPKAKKIIQKVIAAKKGGLTETLAKNLLLCYGFPVNTDKPTETKYINTDYELIIGARTHSNFGSVILFGMGGHLTEVIKDISIGLPPLNRILARQMIDGTKISKAIKGLKGFDKIDISLLEELLIRTCRLITDFPEIAELEINPITVKNGIIRVENANVLISEPCIPAPMHLIISSYPWQYEKKEKTATGKELFIRPIRPSDADLLINHFHSLSEKSIYMRFFSPIKQLSKPMLIKLTQIDYDREIALVALMGKGSKRKLVGVCRIILEPDRTRAEFAIVISDECQGEGIGSLLLKQCLNAAEDMGVKQVIGVVLTENNQMKWLGKKLGFSINHVAGSSEYEMIIDFNKKNTD